jgi:predicted secreted protein
MQHIKQKLKLTILLAVMLVPLLAVAEEESHYNRVNLSVQSQKEAGNDTLVAVLYAQREGIDLEKLSNEVNKIIHQAITTSKMNSVIKVQTLDYQTSPVYVKQQMTGWRVRQSLQLESQDIDAISQLIGKLQASLAMQSISYKVSPSRREKVEAQLIAEAVASFQQRANQITQHLGYKKYQLVSMDVRTSGTPVRPLSMRASPMLESTAAVPTLEPGTRTITVNINGTIELVVN